MISWTRGVFTLDVDKINLNDDYKYLPAQLQDMSLDTQMVLLDALRIFDEKVHAGEITIIDEPLEEEPELAVLPPAAPEENEEIVVSEDILGLADLDKIERKKPRVFKGLEAFDPSEIHRQVIARALPEIDAEQQERLINYLLEASAPGIGDEAVHTPASRSQAIIMYTADEFIQHAIMTICKKEGVLIFMTDQAGELDNLLERALDRQLNPILVFGTPEEGMDAFSREEISRIRSEKMKKFPLISVIQLASPLDHEFSLQSLKEGIRAVLPKPYYAERQQSFVEDNIDFLNTFQSYVHACFNEERRQQFAKLRNSLSGLRLLNKAPDISLSVLQFVSEVFDRALTLIVDKSDLIAERSIGVVADKSQGPSAPLKIRIPFAEDSLVRKLLKERKTYYGPARDAVLEERLYPEIGAPLESQILLLPLQSNGRVITLTYADFGNDKAGQVPLDFLEFFVSKAGISMEKALLCRQRKNQPQPDSH